MTEQEVQMMQEMFQGSMVKILEGKNTGMFIKKLQYNQNTDNLELLVYYFELKNESYYSDSDLLVIPFDRFVNEFAFWSNQYENENVEEAKWLPLHLIINL